MYRSWMFSILFTILCSIFPREILASSGLKTPFTKISNSLFESFLFIPLEPILGTSGVYLGWDSSPQGQSTLPKSFTNFKESKFSIFSPRLGFKVGHLMPYVTVDLSENAIKNRDAKQTSPNSRLPWSSLKDQGEERQIPRLGLEKSFGRFKASIEYGFRRPDHLGDSEKSQGMSLKPSKEKTLHSFKMGFTYGF